MLSIYMLTFEMLLIFESSVLHDGMFYASPLNSYG